MSILGARDAPETDWKGSGPGCTQENHWLQTRSQQKPEDIHHVTQQDPQGGLGGGVMSQDSVGSGS